MKEAKKGCPVCKSSHTSYEFQVGIQRIERCQDCNVLFDSSLVSGNRLGNLEERLHKSNVITPVIEAKARVSQSIERLKDRGIKQGDCLWIGGNDHIQFVDGAKDRGFEVADSDLESVGVNTVDACVLLENLGKDENPLEQLLLVRKVLKLGGLLLATVPTLDCVQARQQKSRWSQFGSGRLTYFDRHGLSALLVRVGYNNIMTWPEPNGLTVLCRKEANKKGRTRLSIVLPVYNERATFDQLIGRVLDKTFDTIEREIIIVESNSSDGSRELVQQYEDHPEINVLYENQPRGKGHAVRNGLKHVSGDVILIQDADLEYDIDDYDAVIEPIATFRRLFVLGSRHKGSWKMRKFEQRTILSAVFNSGQLFFTWLINVACGARLKDPFTMYKVFHRECLYGLQLESNRFDLDWEIVIKFIRKGLMPLEIPVNYTSRSFGEGKKVRLLIDPMFWLIALLKFRYGRLYSGTKSRQRRL